MRNKNIRITIFFAVISLLGVVATQIYWLKKAFDLKERQFNHTASIALQSVAEQILTYSNIQIPYISLVNRLSENYYVVTTNCPIENKILENLLRWEFEKRSLFFDFEYGIYDCSSGSIVYGNYISFGGKQLGNNYKKQFSVWKKDKYYFVIHFPFIENTLVSQMGIWLFSSFVLLIVCMFFAWSMIVILRQKRYSEIQKDFINNMTHEFKTPVSTIVVSADLLRKPEVLQDLGQIGYYTEIIKKEGLRLKDQVEKILQTAQYETKEVHLDLNMISIHDCIHTAISGCIPMIQQKKGEIKLNMIAKNPTILADQFHLTGSIFNLLDNSIKYCTNSPQIEVYTENTSNGIMLRISDNGSGISKKYQKKIFKKFYRIPTGNVHNVKGFGLGLYYVKSIIKAHHGRITVDSNPDMGSTFKLYLPQR